MVSFLFERKTQFVLSWFLFLFKLDLKGHKQGCGDYHHHKWKTSPRKPYLRSHKSTPSCWNKRSREKAAIVRNKFLCPLSPLIQMSNLSEAPSERQVHCTTALSASADTHSLSKMQERGLQDKGAGQRLKSRPAAGPARGSPGEFSRSPEHNTALVSKVKETDPRERPLARESLLVFSIQHRQGFIFSSTL